MDHKKKFFLFTQSDHFCSVPWNHVEIYTNGAVKTCSKGKILDNLLDNTLSEIINSEQVLQLKQTLLTDRPHDNCLECYHLSTGREHTDLRHHYNSLFRTSTVDYDDLSSFKLHGIDLHWDNTCNLKCVYCHPLQSSSIAQEQKVTFQKPKTDKLDQVVDLILENQWNLKEIYFSGGEPMLIKHNLNLLERLENVDIPLRINSNITQVKKGNPFFEQIRRFTNVLWTVSAESTHHRFEYIRHGSQWQEFVKKLDLVIDTGHKIRINSVWFVGSTLSLVDTIKFFINNYAITDFTINQLSGPNACLLVRNAPDSVKDQARDQIKQLLDSSLIEPKSNSYYNILRCNKELDLPASEPNGYKNYFDSLDAMRGTSWKKIFTELDQ